MLLCGLEVMARRVDGDRFQSVDRVKDWHCRLRGAAAAQNAECSEKDGHAARTAAPRHLELDEECWSVTQMAKKPKKKSAEPGIECTQNKSITAASMAHGRSARELSSSSMPSTTACANATDSACVLMCMCWLSSSKCAVMTVCDVRMTDARATWLTPSWAP